MVKVYFCINSISLLWYVKEWGSNINDKRPISLTTIVYKIIVITAAELYWGGFVKGRQILDGILIANVWNTIRLENGLLAKLDIEMVYDKVSWEFLECALARKGFASRWRSWIVGMCLSTHYANLINGSPICFLRKEGIAARRSRISILFHHCSGCLQFSFN